MYLNTLHYVGWLGTWRTLYKPPPSTGRGVRIFVTHTHIIQSTASGLRDVGLLLPQRRARTHKTPCVYNYSIARILPLHTYPPFLLSDLEPRHNPLPLVWCHCCKSRRVIRRVSTTIRNPGRVFYKCPNHGVIICLSVVLLLPVADFF